MKRIGNQTLEIESECFVIGKASIVGDKEKLGSFKSYFSDVAKDDKMGEITFEKGERKMLDVINKKAISSAKLKSKDIDIYLGGDLMNQLVSSNYAAEVLQIPFVGIYSAWVIPCF